MKPDKINIKSIEMSGNKISLTFTWTPIYLLLIHSIDNKFDPDIQFSLFANRDFL